MMKKRAGTRAVEVVGGNWQEWRMGSRGRGGATIFEEGDMIKSIIVIFTCTWQGLKQRHTAQHPRSITDGACVMHYIFADGAESILTLGEDST